jgi:hypothetical protein
MPQTFTDVIDLLIPELRRRGLFWEDYCIPGGTYRENANETPGQAEPLPGHPAEAMIWRPPTSSWSHVNGVSAMENGHAEGVNGIHEDAIDPIAMQFD